jgi:crossover junction endodeoxyribonuclease RuvC
LGKVILGIDPGVARMGFGTVVLRGHQMKAGEYGTLTTGPDKAPEERLVLLYGELGRLLKRVKPEAVAMEELFFSRNAKTAIAVGQARGVALLACGMAKVPVFGYRPMEVKQAVAGYGGADKAQVGRMVKILLGLTEVPKPDDTADALAIAITHAQCAGTALSEAVKRMDRETKLSLPKGPGKTL